MPRLKPALSVADRIVARGNLTVEEFLAWAGVSRATAYEEATAGRLTLTKIGKRCTRVAAADALAWRDAHRDPKKDPKAA